MYILFNFLILSFFNILLSADDNNNNSSISITQAYPGVFDEDPNVQVTNTSIYGINGFSINKFSDPIRNHYDSRKGSTIKYLIMHYTAVNFTNTVEIFTSNSSTNRVSAHYVITEKAENNLIGGQILQVVPDDLRAWHAGVSTWESDSSLNYVSLGIEHVNLGFDVETTTHSLTYYPYDPDQIRASGLMSKEIIKKYNILPQHVLGHQDIAPPRKSDPGPLFPWGRYFHEFGVGAWLDDDEMTKEAIIQKYNPPRAYPTKPDQALLLEMLFAYGFSREGNAENDKAVILAFKAHFSANQHPELYDDVIRDGDMFWAWALEAKYVTATSNSQITSQPLSSNTSTSSMTTTTSNTGYGNSNLLTVSLCICLIVFLFNYACFN